jgi:hypothetical protein
MTPILPGFEINQTMYEAAADGLAEFAPDLTPLTWEAFTAPTGWLLIPDDQGRISKAEMILTCSAERTVKVNVWFRPDVRGGQKVIPHNHRFDEFTGHVVLGGYTDDQYRRTRVYDNGHADIEAMLAVTHAGPDAANRVPHDVFHEVTAVHDPGRTVSIMVCGPGKFGDWCHLDFETGRLIKEQPVAGFDEMLRALNPHRY